MSTITRSIGDALVIGDGITVTLAKGKGQKKVRLVIDAPGTRVERLEVRQERAVGK